MKGLVLAILCAAAAFAGGFSAQAYDVSTGTFSFGGIQACQQLNRTIETFKDNARRESQAEQDLLDRFKKKL